jgi:hypothetical protein
MLCHASRKTSELLKGQLYSMSTKVVGRQECIPGQVSYGSKQSYQVFGSTRSKSGLTMNLVCQVRRFQSYKILRRWG